MPRLDGKYSSPLDIDTSIRANQDHITSRLSTARVDPHWEVMLEELLADRDKGKLTGPYKAPDYWPIPAISARGLPLLDLPTGNVCIATSFSVEQSGKIRRCEDYRRSWHNATIHAVDSPHHHTIEHYAGQLYLGS